MMKKRSLFIVVYYFGGPAFGRVFEIKLDELDHRQGGGKDETPTFKYAAQLYEGGKELGQPILWKFCSLATATSCTSTNLCVLPDSGPEDFMMDDPLNGYILNISTRKVHKMKPPNAPKLFGHVLSLSGNIYFIADPYWIRDAPDPSFERYDPIKGSWESLTPFPFIKEMSCDAEMVGYAVFDDFILFSISGPTYSRQLWAYDVSRNKWYLVNVDNFDCCGFRGLAVVLEKSVYALSSTLSRSVLALSITREQIDGRDPVFTCSLQSVFTLPYTEVLQLHGDRGRDHLVHLGNHEFCLVQSGVCYGYVAYQPIRLSIFQLLGKNSVNITYTIDYEVPLQDFEPFHVRLCFSPPGCEDIVSEREDNSDINFIFDPASEVVKPAPEEEFATLSKEEKIVDTSSFKHSALLNIMPKYPPPRNIEFNCKPIAVQEGELDISTPALFVAEDFVEYYYDDPDAELSYKFYRDSRASCCINGNMTTVDAIESLKDECHRWVIESVDAQESSQKGLTVLVTGYVVGNDNVRRKFAQTFFLASKENGYFILHDMFRFIKDNESLQTNITDEQGHSIHVSNLPYDATVEQLEKEFKKFGSIKRDGI
ncbi:uncharacterized protein LOC133739335 [Rosa rugosa]|uniref:uncharacterized protein LOC133739335 n=1 Tax=Rosa rugosa TaxID=74645 RepID=UPI002B408D06|nr:uncharacterized protein LOC133739335 [Rosa rugosa]